MVGRGPFWGGVFWGLYGLLETGAFQRTAHIAEQLIVNALCFLHRNATLGGFYKMHAKKQVVYEHKTMKKR